MRLAILAATVLLSGCAGNIREIHHFATVKPETGETVNFFRLRLSGNMWFANTRYMAGFYDERAVDLFFNEVNSTEISKTNLGAVPPIFGVLQCSGLEGEPLQKCRAEAEARLRLVPIGADAGRQGAFVMVLSTNVDYIANTIGELASNQGLLTSVVALATKGPREEAARLSATKDLVNRQRAAIAAEVKANAEEAQKENSAWLSVLRAVAAGLNPGVAPDFASFDAARAWFAAVPREPNP